MTVFVYSEKLDPSVGYKQSYSLCHFSHVKCEKATENTGQKQWFELRETEREGNLPFSYYHNPANSS